MSNSPSLGVIHHCSMMHYERKKPNEVNLDLSELDGDFWERDVGHDANDMVNHTALAYWVKQDWTNAITCYMKAIAMILGPDFKLPGTFAAKRDEYANVNLIDRFTLQAATHSIATSHKFSGRFFEALQWTEETLVLTYHLRWKTEKPMFDWEIMKEEFQGLNLLDNKIAALKTAADVVYSLGNSGLAVQHLWLAMSDMDTPANLSLTQPYVNDMVQQFRDIVKLRHPDPTLAATIKVQHPKLQVMGSWRRVKNSSKMNRFNFASFIHDSRLYVAGGKAASRAPPTQEMYSISLSSFDEWRKEPSYPRSGGRDGFFGWTMVVHDHKAYVINGLPNVDYFDLKTNKWSSIPTKFKPKKADRDAGLVGKWPWLGVLSQATAQATKDGKIYVFGGVTLETNIGCNLFMELDLKTKLWRRLSGYPKPKADYSQPGPRRYPSSWTNKDDTRFYLVFGEANREGGKASSQVNRPEEPYASEMGLSMFDFWSFDLKEEKWARERWAGNYPCTRSEVAVAYNPVLEQAVVWGGYTPCQPTAAGGPGPGGMFPFSYFADTFIYGPNLQDASVPGPSWRQTLTRGFPTYRCQAQINCDPATGRMYLFGGFTNTQYLPDCKREITKGYGDLWELRVDLPGGHFEGVTEEEELRTARLGPWKRCFSCGDVSNEWKSCGGTCKGKAAFCGSECLREGWKDHKAMHGCGKA